MEGELTIDELAAVTDMTVRNIRAHQSRGLLPPPRIVGRTGYYGPAHVRRLTQIRAMQDEGLNLAAIARVVSDGRLTDLVVGPFTAADAEPERADPEALLARVRLTIDDPAVARSIELGLISLDGDEVLVHAPRLVAVAEQLTAQGVPLMAMLDAVEVVQEAARRVSVAFLDLADEHLVARVAVDSGGDVDAIRAAVERLRLHASEVLGATFDHEMAEAVLAYFEGTPAPSAPTAD